MTAKEPDNGRDLAPLKHFYILIVANISQIYRHIWMFLLNQEALRNICDQVYRETESCAGTSSLNNKNKQVLGYLHCIIPLL